MIPTLTNVVRNASSDDLRSRIYAFILEELERWQRLPSQDDIRRLFGGRTDDVDLHLKRLEHEGLLLLEKQGGSGITLVPMFIPAPEAGSLAKVAACLARMDRETFGGSIGIDLREVEIPLGCGISAVQVFDDRMIDAGIERGDVALVAHTKPLRGDIVAVEEGEVMVLRRYLIISGIPHFLAENAAAPERRSGIDVPVYGVFWGLLRSGCFRSSARPLSTKKQVSYSNLAGCSEPAASPGGNATNTPGITKRRRKAVPMQTKPASSKHPVLLKPGWPAPVAGVQLNEASGAFHATIPHKTSQICD